MSAKNLQHEARLAVEPRLPGLIVCAWPALVRALLAEHYDTGSSRLPHYLPLKAPVLRLQTC